MRAIQLLKKSYLIFLFFLIEIGMVIFLYNKLPAQSPEESLKTDKGNITSSGSLLGWKVYENSEYKFRVNYPKDLFVSSPYGKNEVRFSKNSVTFYTILASELSGYTTIDGKTIPESELSLKDLVSLDLLQRCPNLDLKNITWSFVEIGGIQGLQATSSNDECIKKYLPWSIVIKDGIRFYIKLNKGTSTEYDQILKSFEFF